ncbi:MAG: signal peptidase I [Chloroflexi bacterium]|nr:signal peptidase I [Chloroflexota bacterium]
MNQSNWLRELLEAALIGIVVFVAIQVAVANFRVEGSSMRPTLMPGHYLMVNKLVYYQLDTDRLGKIIPFWQPEEPRLVHTVRPPQRGDVVVFDYPLEPERQFVKRIIGEPGDLIAIDDGQVAINGETLDEPYLDVLGRTRMHDIQLADDEYFVLGDNRNGSRDSRHWGPLPSDHIIGKVWAIYWPRSAWGFPE